MKSNNRLILTTSPLSQPARKPCKIASLPRRRRLLYGRKRHHSTGKERDTETGLYYYGARYLDGKTSRWLSGDPAVGEYVPEAPVDDEARKRNGSLPGQGGVFNYVNLHVYHYAGNNPVRYIDPNGRKIKIAEKARTEILKMINSVSLYKFDVDSEGYLHRVGDEVNTPTSSNLKSWSFSIQLQEGIDNDMTIDIAIGIAIIKDEEIIFIEEKHGGGVTAEGRDSIGVMITGRDSPMEAPLVNGGKKSRTATQVLVHELTVHAIPLVFDRKHFLENENSVRQQMNWPKVAHDKEHED